MDVVLNLKAFLEVAQTGSFSGAARRLNVAASVVTKRIEQLEWKAGNRLFDRSTRRVSLTEAGHRLLPAAQRIANDVDATFAAMHELPAQLEGPLRLKVPTTLTAFYLAEPLARFQELHPHVTMEILVLDRAVDPLREGFDIAIGMFAGSFGGVIDIGLCALPRLLTASPDYLQRRGTPTHPTHLPEHDIINFQPLGNTWTFSGQTGPIAVTVQPRINSNDGQVLLSSVLAGNGITLLSSYIILPALRAGTLVQILLDFPVPDFWIRALVPENRLHINRVQAMIDFLRAELTPVPPWERRSPSNVFSNSAPLLEAG